MEGDKSDAVKCPHGFFVGDGLYCDQCDGKTKPKVKLNFTETVPTDPGYYLIYYRGAQSGKMQFDLVKLGWKPISVGWRTDVPTLEFEHTDKYGRKWYTEKNFHPDCKPVLWSERIQKPTRKAK